MAFLQNQIDTAVDRLEQLTSRERMLVLVGSVAGILLLGYIVSLWVNSSLTGIEGSNQVMERRLETISQIQGQYEQAQNKVRQIKRKIANNRVDLVRFVSAQSQTFSLNIDSMNFINDQSSSKKNKDVAERAVRIELKKAPLANLAKFLDALENSGKIVKVRKLRMRPNFAEPDKIDVSATVATYTLKK